MKTGKARRAEPSFSEKQQRGHVVQVSLHWGQKLKLLKVAAVTNYSFFCSLLLHGCCERREEEDSQIFTHIQRSNGGWIRVNGAKLVV